MTDYDYSNEQMKSEPRWRTEGLPTPSKPINNDDHPDDKGLHASQEDHWGSIKEIMSAAGRAMSGRPGRGPEYK